MDLFSAAAVAAAEEEARKALAASSPAAPGAPAQGASGVSVQDAAGGSSQSSLLHSSSLSSLALNSCQQSALRKLEEPGNVFLTGVAGSGKSFLIRHYLRDKDFKECPVLASTGAAAILVGGRTFHSFFGLGILQGGFSATVERALGNKRLVKRLKSTQAVIIDEVSMISGTTLRAAETVARRAREKDLPWGGLKVIAVGDFAQLPPVTPNPMPGTMGSALKDWAFTDECWDRSGFRPALLRQIMRTSDPAFLDVLNRVRVGTLTHEVASFLNSRSARGITDFEGTRLFPHRMTVEKFNLEKLAEIALPEFRFETVYFGPEKYVEDLKKAAPVPEVLNLKEGALVMLRQNDPLYRWVNGSLAQVLRIQPERQKIRVVLLGTGRETDIEPVNFSILDADGVEVASARNFPLNLAYATTIHKAQGMTLDRVMVDLRNLWEPGQAYVAMSRVKTGDGLFITGWTASSFRTDPLVTRFYRELDQAGGLF